MATTLEVYPSDSLLWLEFGGQYVNSAGKVVIDNLATRGDAPTTVLCGDGTTASTIPAQATKRGVVFTGTQWIDTGIIDPFERTSKFTLFCVAKSTNNASSVSTIASMDADQSWKGIGLGYNSQTDAALNISNVASTNNVYVRQLAGVNA